MFRPFLATALLSLCALTGVSAQVPELISHQGKLTDAAGEPVPNGTYSMEFRLYDACVGGDLLLTDTHAVQTRNGIYSVLLGGGTLTPGLEPGLLAVFENHSVVCLGTRVGSDTEMVPRQQIVSSGFAMRVASVQDLESFSAKKDNGTYNCGADWNDNGTQSEAADVIACLESALAAITVNEDGSDNSISVKLPDGHFDVSSACSAGSCFELKAGIQITGEMPRLKYVPGAPPDLDMQPNGGTWLDPGPANTLFTGQHLFGVVLEKFGVMNFGRVAVFGGDGEVGIAFSTIRDVYAIGTSRYAEPRTTDAWVFYNIQHLRMDHVKVYDAERGLYIICQTFDFQPANSVISDFYVRTFPDPQGGIRIETIESSGGDSWMMNYITFIRPQVNAFNSTGAPGTTGIWLKGYRPERPVQRVWLIAADVEGKYEAAIRLENANSNRIEVAGTTIPTTGVSIDSGSLYNTIVSVYDRLTLSVPEYNHNMFIGHFDSVDENLMRGIAFDRVASRWSVALGFGGILSSGGSAFWYDYQTGRWRVNDGSPATVDDGNPLVIGTGAGATRGPAIWTDASTSCTAACLDAGMECVDAWAGGASVGCAAVLERRICACR